jgi:tocopherol O-methyltransferase
MGDKKGLLQLFHDLLSPGGKFLMITWCHHDEPPALTSAEKKLLEKIYRVYPLPPMVSVSTLGRLAGEVGFTKVQTDDWSAAVAPFWKAVIRSAFSWRSVRGLWRSGWPAIQGAWAMRYMTEGYRRGTIKFGLVQGQKI